MPNPKCVKLNIAQQAALIQISMALRVATDTGLFDEISGERMHPDQINAFCDGVDDEVVDRELNVAFEFAAKAAEMDATNVVNTSILYSYKDANGYKENKQVVLQGAATMNDVLMILSSTDKSHDHFDFIPGLCNLPDLQSELGDVDHPFHRIDLILPTTDAPEEGQPSFEQFLDLVASQGGPEGKEWDAAYRPAVGQRRVDRPAA